MTPFLWRMVSSSSATWALCMKMWPSLGESNLIRMGAHSHSHFEICLHKNLFMDEKVHEIFSSLRELWYGSFLDSIKCTHSHVHSWVPCAFASPHAKWSFWSSVLLRRSGDNTGKRPWFMETCQMIGLVFAEFTFINSPALIVHFWKATGLNRMH